MVKLPVLNSLNTTLDPDHCFLSPRSNTRNSFDFNKTQRTAWSMLSPFYKSVNFQTGDTFKQNCIINKNLIKRKQNDIRLYKDQVSKLKEMADEITLYRNKRSRDYIQLGLDKLVSNQKSLSKQRKGSGDSLIFKSLRSGSLFDVEQRQNLKMKQNLQSYIITPDVQEDSFIGDTLANQDSADLINFANLDIDESIHKSPRYDKSPKWAGAETNESKLMYQTQDKGRARSPVMLETLRNSSEALNKLI